MYLTLDKYSRPETVEECLRLLHGEGQVAALLAGGTELNVRGHESLTHVIDLQALAFDGIALEGDSLRLGAGVTLGRLRRDDALAGEQFTALRQAAAAFANVGIQNRATLGGRIMVDRPDQDLPPALAALGAQLKIHRLEGDASQASVIDYPLGAAAREALKGALISEVVIPLAEGRSALRRFGRSAVDRPLATCAAALCGDALRLTANMQGPDAGSLRRFTATEKLAAGWLGARPADWRMMARMSLLGEAAAHGDAFASGGYRRDLTATLALRALAAILGEEEIA